MKAPGLNDVFFATIVFGLNGYFIANVCGNEGLYCSALLILFISTHIELTESITRKRA